MGCAGSTPKVDENSKKLKRPKAWKHTQPITPARLKQMRDEFWDTAPHYGGQKEIWDALRVAAESDLALAQTIVDSAGIIVSNPDMTLCYDERGRRQVRAAQVCLERASEPDPRRVILDPKRFCSSTKQGHVNLCGWLIRSLVLDCNFQGQ
ncbi:Ubiquitin domain-containing protein [Zea mays]|uniref:Ubiquitin domain-containing protein n=1 Tax=Zea mays TaxID=4577 RepID=A0A1D6MAB5_MAIZE|nr:Ubiquitin domain-containing protein [Zea mays]